MLEFKINKFLSVKFDKFAEDLETQIFINGEEFIQCSHVLVTIHLDDVDSLNLFSSVDEIPQDPQEVLIPPRVKFFVHCSNLQAWAENNYDTRMIHSNLAFPILKKLTEVGDLQAKRVFKEELINRIKCDYEPTVEYLIREEFTEVLNFNDFESIIGSEAIILKELAKIIPLFLTLVLDDEFFTNGAGFIISDQRVTKLSLIRCDLKKLPESIETLTHL